VREADLARLEAILSFDDARHVYQAAKNSVDYFVTDDRRTILSHKSEIEAIVAIRVRSPWFAARELELL
jgi:hypothetical protein